MAIVDIIFTILLIFFIFRGLKNGLIKELASLIALSLGIYLAIKCSSSLTIWLKSKNYNSEYLSIISFTIITVGTCILIFIFSKLLDKFVSLIKLQWINKVGGVLFAGIKIILVIGAFFYFTNMIKTKFGITNYMNFDKSYYYYPATKLFEIIYPNIINIF